MITNMKAFTLIGLILMLVSSPAMSEQIYRWKDANGTVHFGTKPPEAFKGNVEGMEKPNATGSEKSSTPANNDLNTPPAASQNSAEYEEQLRQLDTEKREACDRALANRKSLLNSHRIQIKQADGTYRMLSHEEKLEQLRDADEAITAYCEGREE